MRTVIFGAGGHGREVAAFLKRECLAIAGEQAIVFATDRPETSEMMGLPVIAATDITADDSVTIAVGDGRARGAIAARLATVGCAMPLIRAASAIVSPDAEIGPGALFSEFALVTSTARIGYQFQCNMYAYVAHDCVIGDCVTFGPRVNCNGNVRIGNYAYVGANATIRQGITIGANAVIGMGAVVVKDVPDGVTVVGNPAIPLA